MARGSGPIVCHPSRPHDCSRRGWTFYAALLQIAAVLVGLGAAGCTPAQYRTAADAESFSILAEKSQNPRWQTPTVLDRGASQFEKLRSILP